MFAEPVRIAPALRMARFSEAETIVRSADRVTVFETAHQGESFMRAHRHERAYISITLDGCYTELRDAVPERRPRGSVRFHPAGEEHADYFDRHVRCLNVEFGRSEGGLDALPGTLPANAVSDAAAQVVRLFYSSGSCPDLLADAVDALLAKATQLLPPPRRCPDWLHDAVERFDWVERVPIHEAASFAGVHPTHFSRSFRNHQGMSPNAFRRRARVRLASQLLLDSAYGLSSIAQRCGFFDQSHFTHCFLQATGLTPEAYRRIFANAKDLQSRGSIVR